VHIDGQYLLVDIKNVAASLTGHSEKTITFFGHDSTERFDFFFTIKEGGIRI
jgi:hypothetical protein